tara:strand:- start:330 stop:2804 length:2475 start_codon:yes stop_codon:yes gene_type:complete
MNGLISGQAGVAAIIEGNEARVISVDEKKKEIITSINLLYRYFMGATDVSAFNAPSENVVIEKLELSWEFDRSFQLMLILLDKNEEGETSLMAAECLENFFKKDSVLDYVSRNLFAAALSSNACIEKALKISHGKPKLLFFLEDLKESQVVIEKYSNAWDSMSLEYFDSMDSKIDFRKKMIKHGTFRDFVKADADSGKFGIAQINALTLLKDLKNYRQILNVWINVFKPIHNKLPKLTKEVCPTINGVEQKTNKWSKGQKNIHLIFKNVEKQKAAISDNIRKDNLTLARRYVEDLIKTQMKDSTPEHTSKSLCDLAQEAKIVYNYSFQLELTQRAVSIAVNDEWAHGQLADAYFCLHKYSEAIESYKDAISCGEESFGRTGLARILLEQGNHEEAFDEYDKLKEKFSESVVWVGFAEVLRRMWWLDEALKAYDESIKKFPLDSVSRCGRAATLTDMGRLDEALEEYDKCIKELGEGEVAINGKGTVFRKMGKFKDALKLYNRATKEIKGSCALLYGYAKTLDGCGDYKSALMEYENICSNYPYESRAWMAKAELFKENREFDKAIDVYDNALERFPFSQQIRNGRASVYKKQGTYEKALQTYEINLSKAPYDFIAKAGKADLLKELGEFKESLRVYDELIKKYPNKRAFQHAKASIHIALEEHAEAESLLLFNNLSTIDDWIAYHVRGMLFLKNHKLEEAVNLFENGLNNCPFIKERTYFNNSLAVAKIKKSEFKQALKLLSNCNTPTTNILSLHALGGLEQGDNLSSKKAKIIKDCLEVDCPPYLLPLMIELELRYFGDFNKCKHDEEWIFQQECNSGALSSV